MHLSGNNFTKGLEAASLFVSSYTLLRSDTQVRDIWLWDKVSECSVTWFDLLWTFDVLFLLFQSLLQRLHLHKASVFSEIALLNVKNLSFIHIFF